MAIKTGTGGKIKLGSDTVASVESWTLSETSGIARTEPLGATSTTKASTIKDGSGNLNCNMDPADTAGQEALAAGASTTITLIPHTEASTEPQRVFTAIITGVTETGSNSDFVKRNIDFEVSGDIDRTAQT